MEHKTSRNAKAKISSVPKEAACLRAIETERGATQKSTVAVGIKSEHDTRQFLKEKSQKLLQDSITEAGKLVKELKALKKAS